uniref:Integrin-binding sialoprotein n=1 Tax=Otolemur garnettii TaxID=30611 RepID=H0X499_OTOGA
MKTALILLSILGMACAFSMKNLHRRVKPEDSEENGVFKYRPRYYLYKHAYFYPALKRFPVQSSSDSSEENEDGDSSEEEEEEEETSNEEEKDENSNGGRYLTREFKALEKSATMGEGVLQVQGHGRMGSELSFCFSFQAGDMRKQATKKEESDEEEEEEEEEENENEENEAEVDENDQGVNGTSTNSTETENGNGSSGGDAGEGGEGDSVTGETAGTRGQTTSPNGGFQPTTPPPEVYGTPSPPSGKTTTFEYEEEYEQTGTNEYDNGYEVYDSENGEPRGDTYRAYEDEYSYYKGQSYDGYEGYYYHQ